MIKSILKYAGKYKILTIVATIMVVIAVAAQILPYIFAYQIISPLIAGESIPWQFAVGRVVGVAVCLVLNFVFYLGGLSLSHIAAFNTLYNLRVSLQGKMEKLPLGVVQEKGTGNLKKLFVDDVESMELLLAHAIPEGIGNLLIPIGVFIAMFAVDWKLALLQRLREEYNGRERRVHQFWVLLSGSGRNHARGRLLDRASSRICDAEP